MTRKIGVCVFSDVQDKLGVKGDKIVDFHSHPSTQGASEHDMLNAKGKNEVSFGVYFKDNKTLYEYNSVRSNLNSIKMNSMLDLIRYTFRQYNKNR